MLAWALLALVIGCEKPRGPRAKPAPLRLTASAFDLRYPASHRATVQRGEETREVVMAPEIREVHDERLLAASVIHLAARLNAVELDNARHVRESPPHVRLVDPAGRDGGAQERARPGR